MNQARVQITKIMGESNSPITTCDELKDACSIFDGEIRFLEEPDQHYPYTCMQYCMDCTTGNVERYNSYMQFKGLKIDGIDMVFLGWLIDHSYLVLDSKEKSTFVTYWENTDPKHIGFSTSKDQVVSKWGVGGPLIKHGLLDVPSLYGSDIKWYRWSEEYNVLELIEQFLDKLYEQGKI